MAENSKIEWTDHTFNPWTGCTKVSPGCEHCYAEGWAKRSGTVQWGDAPRRRTTEANWKLPLKWNAQAEREGRRFRVFCASLADVFDNQVPPQWRADLFKLIADTPHLDWLLLTKRIGNVFRMLPFGWQDFGMPSNIWLGATIVNQEEADRDIPKLMALPARVRFLSMEPLLGPVDLRAIDVSGDEEILPLGASWLGREEYGPRVDWVIVGGESGPGARPMHPAWARKLRDQCEGAGVPFLFKQWGEWCEAEAIPDEDDRIFPERWMRPDGTEPAPGEGVDFFGGDEVVYRAGKKTAGRQLDGVTHDGFPC